MKMNNLNLLFNNRMKVEIKEVSRVGKGKGISKNIDLTIEVKETKVNTKELYDKKGQRN